MQANTVQHDRKLEPGIVVRHSRSCRLRRGEGACACSCPRPGPTFLASVWSRRDGKEIRRTFGSLAEARAWRDESRTNVRKGKLRAPTQITLREAADEYLAGMKDGSIRSRGKRPYKPSAIRAYRWSLDARVLPDLGARKLSEITRDDVQDLADRLTAEGLNGSTVRNHLMPLRAIFRRAVMRGWVTVNPMEHLDLPAVDETQRDAVPYDVAVEFIAELPEDHRALWATAFFGGLRLGELSALDWSNVNLGTGVIDVAGSWDRVDGPIDPNSRQGARKVLIYDVLRRYLRDHQHTTLRLRGLVFGPDGETPPSTWVVGEQRKKALARLNAKRAERGLDPVEPFTLHDARRTSATG